MQGTIYKFSPTSSSTYVVVSSTERLESRKMFSVEQKSCNNVF